MGGQEQAEATAEPVVPPQRTDHAPGNGTPARRMLAERYELGDRLGRGGMGTVWRARDLMLDREVAVKELTVNHLPEEDLAILQSRMKQEARAAARIKHPGVITIHDVLEQDGRPWIVMELIDGRSLADVIAQDGTLAPREAAEVGAQVLAALHRGHQLGVLHRDVKPANVLLEHGTGRAVLLDFGIAKFEGGSELTRPGDLVGSPDYLAPERAHGERPGPASDLWGLGATLFAAVEGQSPFRRDSPLNTLAAVVADPLPPSPKAGPLGPVLAALLEKDAADRPSADEAQRMLREVTSGHTLGIAPLPRVEQRVPTQLVPVVDRRPAEAADAPVAAEVPQREATAPTGAGGADGEQVTAGSPAHTRTRADAHAPTRPHAQAPARSHAPAHSPAHSPAPVGPTAAARRRRSGLRVALDGLLAPELSGAVAFAVVRFGGAGDHAVADPGSSASTPGAPLTDEPTGAPVTAGPPPSGYRWQSDELGFRFPLPVDGGTWTRTTNPTGNVYYSPDGQRHLIQFAVAVGQPLSPLQHLTEMAGQLAKGQKDYRTESLSQAKVHGLEAARWVFSYTNVAGSNAGPRWAIEEEYMDADGTSYSMLVSGPAGEVDKTLTEQRFTILLNYFSATN
ncbi:serine/threonine-protein kinase [Kitasatospora nipponensis]|uniref:non-specific serine/threonine protein kinase n=1 Tax=Kitasatospora nipponensis TaxID=258049 RepID=A0ABN1T7P0_9ACTN